MTKLSRKIVIITALTAFLLNAANVFLYIHLAEHEHDKGGHDNKHCSICQQAAVNKNEAVIPSVSVSFELPHIFVTDIFVTEHIVKNFSFLIPYLRAPPAAA